MRLRWYDRILVALGGLILVALGVCVILAAGGVITLPEAIAFDTWLGDGWQWMPLIFLAGALIVIWGLWLFIRPFKRGDGPAGKYYTLQDEAEGNVRISVHAIDHLVRKCINGYPQILTTKIRISGKEESMRVTLHMTVQSQVRIPELVSAVRQDVKATLQHSAGVIVESVEIYVDATKDDKDAKEEIKYLESHAPKAIESETAAAEPQSAESFYTAPVVVTASPKPEAAVPVEPTAPVEPTVKELEREIDFGPEEPLPVDLSKDAFPFPEEEAGVPLEIYTPDLPIEDDEAEDALEPDEEESHDA